MVLKNMNDLRRLLDGGIGKKLVLAAAEDQHSLGAVIKAWKEGIIDPILVGDEAGIHKICEVNNYDITGIKIVNEPDPEKSVEVAVKMVHNQEASILMKGKIGSAALCSDVYSIRNGVLEREIFFLILHCLKSKHIRKSLQLLMLP